MTKKLTITVSDEVYEGLHARIGPRKISGFIDAIARPHVTDEGAEALYREAAADGVRERAAAEWDELPADEELPDEVWPGAQRAKRRT